MEPTPNLVGSRIDIGTRDSTVGSLESGSARRAASSSGLARAKEARRADFHLCGAQHCPCRCGRSAQVEQRRTDSLRARHCTPLFMAPMAVNNLVQG